MRRSTGSDIVSSHGWNRIRVQLGGGLVFGVGLPLVIATTIDPEMPGMPLFPHSVLASLAGVLLGYYLYRSITNFPGIQASYYILPVFSSSFALAVMALFFLRLEYSRTLLLLCYLMSIGWYYLVYFRSIGDGDLHIGVVPFGDVEAPRGISNVAWEYLAAPSRAPMRMRAVVADFRADMPDEWERFLADTALSGIPVLHVKRLRESLTGQVEIEHLSENAQGSLVPQAAFIAVKGVVDRVVAAAAVVALLPVMLAVAVVVRLDSPGPVLFRQQRVGYRGDPFQLWKFRTMAHRQPVAAAEARADAITLAEDVRITRVGKFLRRARLDELPQLVNVLRGQMSFIGPRPEAEVLSHWYQQEIPFYRYRHVVRPGITGWAQVNQGHVADVKSVHSKLNYDFYYIMNFSLWLDILIVLRTVRTVLTGFGSK